MKDVVRIMVITQIIMKGMSLWKTNNRIIMRGKLYITNFWMFLLWEKTPQISLGFKEKKRLTQVFY
jgi:hypothetical protein